ncbi:MAG: alternative ribosome rescue aminoacyl-tRNA hydrolase ArfB [Pirellulaceae bacterium]|nr:alternative ribosome rescue aminoacyl-tRNA hydrolase ArfB [Pirellulaceae bacterium]
MLKINERINIPLREFDFWFARSSGPGGQNVNKVNSKAFLSWNVKNSPTLPAAVKIRFMNQFSRRISKEGVLIIKSQRFRDQGRNNADCLTKLTEMIQMVAIPQKSRIPTKPSRNSKQRRLDGKKVNSEKKRRRKPPQWGDHN